VIDRTVQRYTFTVTATATEAESVAVHLAKTAGTDTGFTNVLTDSGTATGNSITPICYVTIPTFTFDGYSEKSDYSGPMVASFSGEITAEKSCDDITSSLRVKSQETDNFVGSSTPTLTKTDDYTYSFTTTVETTNTKDNFLGVLKAWDTDNEADHATATTEYQPWEPPCYLDVVSFTKDSQTTSVDNLKAQITYTLKLAVHGDATCEETTAKLTMSNDAGNTFTLWLLDHDIEAALGTDGYTYTVSINTANAGSAAVAFMDPSAVQDATATAAGWVAENGQDCSIVVQDFCLDSASNNGDGTWNFDFTIRAASNSNCGTVTATMELIDEETEYLAKVTIPDN